jgi:large subunit ribosomal protein L10
MNREQKAEMVGDLQGLVTESKAMVLLAQNGLTMAETTRLRRDLGKEGASLRVLKNTLMTRAVKGSPWEFLASGLKGPIAMAYTRKDVVALAKAVTAALKGNTKIAVIGGALGKRPLKEADLKVLASLPPIEVLKGSLLGALGGVPRKFLGILQAPGRDFLGVLKARERKLAGE